MSLGMKTWLGMVATGMALIALRTLPPSPFEMPLGRAPTTQAERHLDALRAEAVRTNMALQRLRWADAMVPATLAGDGPVAFGFPERAVPEQAERIRERTLAEAAATPSDVAVGLYFLLSGSDAYPGAPTGPARQSEYFFGGRDGRPYCVTVRPSWRLTEDGRIALPPARLYESYLGLCALIRRYGLPGSAVEQWLAGGGAALATTARPGAGLVVPSYLLGDLRGFQRRGLLGRRPVSVGFSTLAVPMDRCFAGVVEGCADLFLHPVESGGPRAYAGASSSLVETSAVSAVQESSYFQPLDQFVAADLADQFGDARFRAWWTADDDVGDAFRAAFGVDVGTWYLHRIGALVPISRPGPAVGGSGLLGGLLLLALSTVLAAGWARKRRIA